jgi:hypothetical protein
LKKNFLENVGQAGRRAGGQAGRQAGKQAREGGRKKQERRKEEGRKNKKGKKETYECFTNYCQISSWVVQGTDVIFALFQVSIVLFCFRFKRRMRGCTKTVYKSMQAMEEQRDVWRVERKSFLPTIVQSLPR